MSERTAGTGASGEDREVVPSPCDSTSQQQVQGTRDAEGAPDVRDATVGLTDDQRAAGCWVCACDAVRMVWDCCGLCGETEDGRLLPERRAVFRTAKGMPPEARELAVDPASGTRADSRSSPLSPDTATVSQPPSGEPVGEPEICGRVSPDGRVVCTAIAGHPMPHHHHLTGFSWSTGEPVTFAPLSPLSPDERAMRWAATVTALESRLLAAEAARARAEQLLEKATTRLGILRDRMEACDDAAAILGETDRHRLSRFEIDGWIEEQTALARATPEGPDGR